MKAIVYHKYGSPDVLRLEERVRPTPRADEILVKVQAASVNAFDWHVLKADPFLVRLSGFGLFKPKYQILGADIAGRVESVGAKVTKFKPGDEVFGDTSIRGIGGFAEYACTSEKLLALKPAGITFEEAAAVPMAALTALQGLRDKARIKPGQKVLINGASGGVGTFAVQLAKVFGAETTAVCSTGKLVMARSLGADHVIDYTKTDFTESGQRYDIIYAVNGFQPLWRYRRALTDNGIYVMSGGDGAQMFQAIALAPLLSISGGKRMRTFVEHPNGDDLNFMAELLETGKVKPVIDKRYSLAEVPQAIGYLIEGHARGKVIINVNRENRT